MSDATGDAPLEELLRESLVTVGAGPDPARVAALRQRAQAPASPSAGTNRKTARRLPLLPLLAAAAVVIVALVAGTVVLRRDDAPAVVREEVAVDEVQRGLDADATLIAHTWGTEITLVARGLGAGAKYEVSFIDSDGGRVAAGTFLGVGAKPVTCNLNAAVLRPDARSFEVADRNGQVVLRADLS